MPSFFTPPHRPDRSKLWPEGVYYLRADTFPVHPDSDQMVDDIAAFHNAESPISPGFIPGTQLYVSSFNTKEWERSRQAGYFSDKLPDAINADSARVNWSVNEPYYHQEGKHLWFSDLRQEGAFRDFFGNYQPLPPWERGDKHSLMYHEPTKEIVESIGYGGNFGGAGATAQHTVTYITDDYELPRAVGDDWNTYSAGSNVIRIPVGPFLFCYQDLVDCGTTGDLGHMLGFQLGGYSSETVWPARNSDGGLSVGFPAGTIIRLRDDFDINSLVGDNTTETNALRALARTMRKYGMMLFDRTNRFRLVTVNDPAWPDDFGGVKLPNGDFSGFFDLYDFEAIDHSSVATPMYIRHYPLEPAPESLRIGLAQTSGSVETKHEQPTGKPIGIHRRFISSWNNRANVLTELQNADAASRSLWISIKTPSWGAVAAGTHDAEINSLMTSLKNTYTNIWFTPYHEPEDNVGTEGTAAQYRAMIERFVTRKNAVGAKNVLIVPILMSYTFRPDSGRNPDDWVVLNEDIPMYGIDFYSNTYDTVNLNLSNNSEWNAMYDYMEDANLDIALGEVGGAIGTSTPRNPNFWRSVVNECLDDPSRRVKAICWFDDGTNQLGGASSDPGNGLLAAFHESLIADYSYRGGSRRMPNGGKLKPTGAKIPEEIESIKATSLVYEDPNVVEPSGWKPQAVVTMV